MYMMNAASRNLMNLSRRGRAAILLNNRRGVAPFSSTTRLSDKLKDEAPKKKGFLYRMAPPKGGTDPPDAKFIAVATVVLGAGYYSWFIHEDET